MFNVHLLLEFATKLRKSRSLNFLSSFFFLFNEERNFALHSKFKMPPTSKCSRIHLNVAKSRKNCLILENLHFFYIRAVQKSPNRVNLNKCCNTRSLCSRAKIGVDMIEPKTSFKKSRVLTYFNKLSKIRETINETCETLKQLLFCKGLGLLSTTTTISRKLCLLLEPNATNRVSIVVVRPSALWYNGMISTLLGIRSGKNRAENTGNRPAERRE